MKILVNFQSILAQPVNFVVTFKIVFSILGTIFVSMTFYWSTALAFMFMDYTQRPAFLMKYKIQQGKNTPPNTAKVIKVSKNDKMSEIMRQKTKCPIW